MIINKDCLEALKELPDNSIDVIITDPPYGINISNKNTLSIKGSSNKQNIVTKKEWDSFIPTKEYFEEMIRVSKKQIIFGGNYFAHLLPPSKGWLVWWKKDGLPRGTFADCELVWTSIDMPAQVFNSRWHGFIRDSKEDKVAHPTQKALAVMEWIVKEFTNENETILDPFTGSGTTGIACKKLNRNFIGIERDEEYCKIATARIESVSQNNTLFV